MLYPVRAACPHCGAGDLAEQTFTGKGDVNSYTVITDAPPGFVGETPYTIALVHLAEGAYVSARLDGIDPKAIFIGMPVERAATEQRLTFRPRRSLIE
jgi:hypothetical protein